MPRVGQILVPTVALLAGIVIAGVLYRMGATNVVGAILLIGFVTIAASYCDLLLDRLAERDRIDGALDNVAIAHERLRAESDLARRAIVELKLHVDDRFTTRNDRVISEVKVLESLVRKLAEGIATKASIHPPSADERISRRAHIAPSRS